MGSARITPAAQQPGLSHAGAGPTIGFLRFLSVCRRAATHSRAGKQNQPMNDPRRDGDTDAAGRLATRAPGPWQGPEDMSEILNRIFPNTNFLRFFIFRHTFKR
ncbi:hypothetical protein [Salibaculum halophilum]|uniref:hypothetical protein n=1 Tax=Salibaculum halophilum TaxID=1914408 RepID=UPI00117B0C1E|nr:hypothetical protein [Salibaculum halophilum]